MADIEQSYANHKRFFPLWHYVIFPILLVNFVAQVVVLARNPSWGSLWAVVVALTLAGVAFTSRYFALVVQNRLIRLEERLRLSKILPPELQDSAAGLRTGQLVALRFASDAEVPGLVRRCVDGELKTSDQIKRSIREWRADNLRV